MLNLILLLFKKISQMKNISIVIIFSFIIFKVHAQDRQIYFVHGLGGDNSSWSKPKSAVEGTTLTPQPNGFPARKAKTDLVDYIENDLETAGQTLAENIAIIANTNNANVANSFIIAHSQGGLVSKTTELRYNKNMATRKINGIVTFGTPHKGALLINNVKNQADGSSSNVSKFLNDGCASIIQGPISAGLYNTAGNFSFLLQNKAQDVENSICNLLGNTVLPQFAFKEFNKPITQGYAIGSPVLDALDDPTYLNPNTHKVAFYGEENDPVLWRTVYNILTKKPQDFDYFTADDTDAFGVEDQQALKDIHSIIDYYTAKEQYYDYKANILHCWGWGSILGSFGNYLCAQDAAHTRDGYQRGINWLQSADYQWQALIGAKVFDVDPNLFDCFCDYYPGDPYNGYQTTTVTDTPCDVNYSDVVCTTLPHYGIITKPNDGIVLSESAMNFVGTTDRTRVRLLGSNHQQMRNDKNTKSALNELLRGHIEPWFYTLEK